MSVGDFAFCGFRSGSVTNGHEQRALLIGRQYLVERIVIYNGFSFPGPTTVRPFVIPWARTVDQWGVAYPAGLYGVSDWVARWTPGAGVFDTDWAALWDESIIGNLSHVVAVPQVLPVGYTARPRRDWGYLRPSSAIAHDYSPGGGYRIRTPTGYTRYNWTPDSRIWGFTGIQVTSSGPSPSIGSKYFGVYDTGIGYRQLQINVQYLELGGVPWTGSADVILSHNAAGPSGVVTTDGDTIDFSASYPYASFSGGGVGTTYSTGWINVGPVLPTLGTVTDFKGSLDLSSIAGLSTFGVVVSFRLSPRCDVPLPYTTTNRGNIVAMGGTV